MAIKMAYVNGGTNPLNRSHIFFIDVGDSVDDLPTSDDAKGTGYFANPGDTAFSYETDIYMYFENAGWVEMG